MNRTSNECINSSDCTFTNSLGVTVNRFCYEEMKGVDEVFFCDCFNRYGFTGDNCDEPSTQTTLLRFILLAQVFTSFMAFPLTVYILWSYLKAREALKSRERTISKQTFYIVKCLSLIIVSLVLIMGSSISDLVLLGDPTKTTIVSSRRIIIGKNEELIFGPLGQFSFYCVVTSIYCLLIMTVLVLLSWLRVILGVKAVVDEPTIRRINRFINGTTIAMAISSMFLMTFLFNNYRAAASVTYNIMSLVLLGLNIYARRTFILKIGGLALKRESLSAIKAVKGYSAVYLGTFVFNTVLLLFYVGFGVPASRTSPPGEVEYATITIELFILLQYVLLYYALSYIRYLVNNLILSARNALGT